MTIWIDPGHGGTDPGAVREGTTEVSICWPVAVATGLRLSALHPVRFTRSLKIAARPRLRAEAINGDAQQGDCVVSIHVNSHDSTTANGFEVLYVSEAGKGLAQAVQSAFASSQMMAGLFRNRGLKHRPDLTILKATTPPAILVELGFLSNPSERLFLRTAEVQLKFAELIAEGVNNWLFSRGVLQGGPRPCVDCQSTVHPGQGCTTCGAAGASIPPRGLEL